MDKSKFDDIIREKLESHVDPSGPSGAEMTRLFTEIPTVISPVISSFTKVLVTISSLMVLITIFLIYRNYRLEETMESLQIEIAELGKGQSEVSYFPDTLFWDSLESITKRVLVQNGNGPATVQSSTTPILNSSLAQVSQIAIEPIKLSAVDSQEFVNQVMAQLIATLENNPELLKELLSELPIQSDEVTDSSIGSEPSQKEIKPSSKEFRRSIVSELDEQNAVQKILEQIAEDSVGSMALVDIVFGNEPGTESEDQLSLGLTTKAKKIGPSSLGEEKQRQVLEEYLAYDPTKVVQISKELQLDSASVLKLEEYAEMNDMIRKDVVFDSLVLDRQQLLSNEEVRDQQKEVKNKSWLIGGGAGFGIVDLKEFEKGTAISLKTKVEYQPNKKVGFSSGVEFYTSEAENHDVSAIDFSLFEGLPSDIATTAQEIKVNLKWLDIPLEAKVYLFPGKKINPYVALSVRARVLVGEEYKFETNTDDIIPSFQPREKFVFPTYGFGLGATVELNPRVRSGLQINQLLGGKELGLLENQYRVFNGEAYLLFRLSK